MDCLFDCRVDRSGALTWLKDAFTPQAVLHELHVGVTMMMIENGISQKSNRGVISVIPRRKLYDAEKMIQTIDPDVFMTITQIKEARGQGFTRAREEYATVVLKE